MVKWVLLASTYNLESISKLIAKYWFTDPDRIKISKMDLGHLIKTENLTFMIYQNNKPMTDFRVIRKNGRYRFEGKV
jgi:hypothetical protein